MSNEITNEQLEVWASLGPWLKQYSPTIDAMQIIEPVVRDLEGHVPIPRKIAHVYEGQRMDIDRIKLHSDALAAAPALAAALLAERKAREVEVGALKRTMFTVRVIAVDAQLRATYQRTALERISAELRTALEGPTP